MEYAAGGWLAARVYLLSAADALQLHLMRQQLPHWQRQLPLAAWLALQCSISSAFELCHCQQVTLAKSACASSCMLAGTQACCITL